MEFTQFSRMIKEKFDVLSHGVMFTTNCDPDFLWNLYLGSFPAGTNEVYRERNARIKEIIAQKQDADLQNKSVEELEKMLDE